MKHRPTNYQYHIIKTKGNKNGLDRRNDTVK
jgi:hypothetical protein